MNKEAQRLNRDFYPCFFHYIMFWIFPEYPNPADAYCCKINGTQHWLWQVSCQSVCPNILGVWGAVLSAVPSHCHSQTFQWFQTFNNSLPHPNPLSPNCVISLFTAGFIMYFSFIACFKKLIGWTTPSQAICKSSCTKYVAIISKRHMIIVKFLLLCSVHSCS